MFFTSLLWLIFAYLAIVRSNVTQAYEVQDAVVNYVEGIISHPGVSGVRLRTPAESNMPQPQRVDAQIFCSPAYSMNDPRPCRCGCRHIGGFPESSCTDDGQTERFEFLGRLPGDTAERLVAATGGFYPMGAQDMEPMTWRRIRGAEDVLVWLEHGFLPNVWGTVAGRVIRRPGLILNRNLVVGGVRARQRRAQVDLASCNLPIALQSWYSIRCRNAAVASNPFGPLENINFTLVDQMPVGVRNAFLSTGIGAYDAYFDVERPLRDALETATQLRRNGWLTEATTSLQLEALMLNGESGSFVILSITFEWLNDGAITKSVRSHVFRAVPGQTSVMDFLPEICWLALILLLLRQELWEVLKMTFKRELRLFTSSSACEPKGLSGCFAAASQQHQPEQSKEATCRTFGISWIGFRLGFGAYFARSASWRTVEAFQLWLEH